MLLRSVLGQKQAGRFDHDLGADLVPFQLGRIPEGGEANPPAVHDQDVAVNRDLPLESAVHRIVLEHIGQIVGFKQIVDADDLEVLEVLSGGAKHHAADAAESVDP